MAKKDKQVEVLDNDAEVFTTKVGWNSEDMKGLPAQAAGWKEGAAPHFSVGLGMLKAVAESPNTKEFVVGNYVVGDEIIPIIDAPALTQDILKTYAESKELEIQTFRLAGSRTGARKELDEIKSTFAGIDDAAMKILEETNPEVYAKIMGFQA